MALKKIFLLFLLALKVVLRFCLSKLHLFLRYLKAGLLVRRLLASKSSDNHQLYNAKVRLNLLLEPFHYHADLLGFLVFREP